MIEIDNISRYYGQSTALEDVRLSVDAGRCLVLLGPSGSGKTTLLRIVAGLDRPDDGEIRLEGRTASTAKAVMPPESRNMAMIFQSLALWPHMTALAHIAFAANRRRGQTGGKDRRDRALDILARMHLTGREKRYPHELSGGEKQRLAIARALAAEPGCLLMDEPFSNLDPHLKEDLLALTLREKTTRNMAVVYVTHQIDEALAAADEMAVLRDGKIRKTWSGPEISRLERRDVTTAYKKAET